MIIANIHPKAQFFNRMKKILIFLTVLSYTAVAQFAGQGGVNFLKGNLRTPFDAAKQNGIY